MTSESRFDSVGWIFFGVTWILSIGPVMYSMFQITDDSTPLRFQVGSAILMAGIVAAVISWIVNSILGFIADRRTGSTDAVTVEEEPVAPEVKQKKPTKKKSKKKK